MASKRGRFSPEFKEQMVKTFLDQQATKTVSQVARENGVGTETLRSLVAGRGTAVIKDVLPVLVGPTRSCDPRAHAVKLCRQGKAPASHGAYGSNGSGLGRALHHAH